jgi:hypothetical protein
MMKHGNQVMTCTLLTALIALGTGCGGSGGGTGGDGAGGSGSDNTSSASDATSASSTGADCEGAFTTVEAPYAPNNAIEDWGGFVADAQGLVFSSLPDSTQDDYDSDLPPIMGTSDLSGNVETIYTFPEGAMPGPIFAFGDDIYFAEGLLSRHIMKMPRAGGEATPVSDDGLRAGPVRDGDKLYYSARESLDSSIVALDMASGETETLAETGEIDVVAIAMDGDTLYFAEMEDVLAETDYSLYSMPAAGGDPELVTQLPFETVLGGFRVVDGVGFGSGITADISIVINRFEFGEAPVVVEDRGGVPMVIAGDTIYYSGGGSIQTNSLAFDDPGVISEPRARGIGAIAVSESSVWYASSRCIYQVPR